MRLLLAFILSTTAAFGCFIETHDQIVILNQGDDFSALVKNSDCSSQEQERFVDFARNAQGTITALTFNKIFPNTTLRPERVQIHSLSDQMAMHGLLPKHGQVITANRLNDRAFIALNRDQRFDLECPACTSVGENTVKFTIRDQLGLKHSTQWFKVRIGVPTKAYVATKVHQASLNPLDPSGFEIKTIITDRPQELAHAEMPLHFYKISRTLSPGEELKRGQISPVQLVRPGVEAHITVQDGGVLIKGIATPLSFGVYGETIKLKNNRSSRTIMGKVVDHNKVIVEL